MSTSNPPTTTALSLSIPQLSLLLESLNDVIPSPIPFNFPQTTHQPPHPLLHPRAPPSLNSEQQPQLLEPGTHPYIRSPSAFPSPPSRVRNPTKPRVRCTHCPELFESPVNALRHRRGSHPATPHRFRCPRCTASYESKGARTIHIKRAHFERPPVTRPSTHRTFRCRSPGCGKTYSAACNLKRHFEIVHLQLRYPCAYCQYRATTKSNLKVHVGRMHTCLE